MNTHHHSSTSALRVGLKRIRSTLGDANRRMFDIRIGEHLLDVGDRAARLPRPARTSSRSEQDQGAARSNLPRRSGQEAMTDEVTRVG